MLSLKTRRRACPPDGDVAARACLLIGIRTRSVPPYPAGWMLTRFDLIRSLIEVILLMPEDGELKVELRGALAGIRA